MPKIIDDSAAAELANSLKQRFRGVKYNSKTREGFADIGGITINFHESNNERSVWMDIHIKLLKIESGSLAIEFLDNLRAELRHV